MLGAGNVFLMFVAVAYVALECKTLLMSSVISNPVVQRQWVFQGSPTEPEKRPELMLRGKGKRGNLCEQGGGDGMFICR